MTTMTMVKVVMVMVMVMLLVVIVLVAKRVADYCIAHREQRVTVDSRDETWNGRAST